MLVWHQDWKIQIVPDATVVNVRCEDYDGLRRLHRTIWIVRLAQEEVVAGAGRVVQGTHWELHALNVLFDVVERPEDVVHSLHCCAVVGVRVRVLHVSLPSGSFVGMLDGERLDHVSRRTLQTQRTRSAVMLLHPADKRKWLPIPQQRDRLSNVPF